MMATKQLMMMALIGFLGACSAKPSFLVDEKEKKKSDPVADDNAFEQDLGSDDAVADVATEEQRAVDVQVGGETPSGETVAGTTDVAASAPESTESSSMTSDMTVLTPNTTDTTSSSQEGTMCKDKDDDDHGEMDRDDDKEDEHVSEDEIAECRKQIGGHEGKVILAGKDKNMTIEVGSLLIVKVAGAHNELVLNLAAGENDAKLAGVCVFITGNQNHVTVNVGEVDVDHVSIMARGNEARGEIHVAEGGKCGHVDIDEKGHNHQITISGKGTYSCPEMLSLRRPEGQVLTCNSTMP